MPSLFVLELMPMHLVLRKSVLMVPEGSAVVPMVLACFRASSPCWHRRYLVAGALAIDSVLNSSFKDLSSPGLDMTFMDCFESHLS